MLASRRRDALTEPVLGLYLLDTNHCSRILLGDQAIVERTRTVGLDQVCTSAIVAGELLFMAGKSARREDNTATFRAFLESLQVLPITPSIADVYGLLKADLLAHYGPGSGKPARKIRIEDVGFTDNDLWIAATALDNNLTIVSRDADFQRILPVRALQIENWYSGGS